MNTLKRILVACTVVLAFGCVAGDVTEDPIKIVSQLSRYLNSDFRDVQRSWVTGETLQKIKDARGTDRTANADHVGHAHAFGVKSDKLLAGSAAIVQDQQNQNNQGEVTKEVTKIFFRAIFLKAIRDQEAASAPTELSMMTIGKEGGNALWLAYQKMVERGVENPLDLFDPLVVDVANAMGDLDVTSLGTEDLTNLAHPTVQELDKISVRAIKKLTANLRLYLSDPEKKISRVAEFVLRDVRSDESTKTAIKAYRDASEGDREAKLAEAVSKTKDMMMAGIKEGFAKSVDLGEMTQVQADEQADEQAKVMAGYFERNFPLMLDPVGEQVMMATIFALTPKNMKNAFASFKTKVMEEESPYVDDADEKNEVIVALRQVEDFTNNLPAFSFAQDEGELPPAENEGEILPVEDDSNDGGSVGGEDQGGTQ